MSVSAHFEWDGITCAVSNETYDQGLQDGYDMRKWDESSSDSGTFNKAYCKVNYEAFNSYNIRMGSGKLEVTCSKTGS